MNAIVIAQGIGVQDYTFALHDVNADIATVIEKHDGWVVVRPMQPLAATTTYSVDVTGYGLPVAHTTFTTGTTMDVTPITFVGLSSWSAETMEYPVVQDGKTCLSSCVVSTNGVITSSTFEFDDPPGTETVLVTATIYRASDHTIIDDERPMSVGVHRLGYMLCQSTSPALDPGETYCAHVTAYDIAGNASGSEVETCATAAVCAPIVDAFCQPSQSCEPPAPSPAPSGCMTTRGCSMLVGAALLLLRRRRAR